MKSTILVPRGANPTGPHADKIAKLLSKLQKLTSLSNERKAGHWIGLHYDWWEANFRAADYKGIRDDAIAQGFIEENSTYSKGRFPKSYRLARQYRVGATDVWELQRKPAKQSRKQEEQSLLNLGAVGIALTNRLEQFTVMEDYRPKDDWDAFAVGRLRSHDIYATRCEFLRYHSNCTSLSKTARQALQTDSREPLKRLDVSASQLLVLAHLAETWSTNRHNRSATPLCPINSGVMHFRTLCEAGEIYPWTHERVQESYCQPYWVERRHRSGRVSRYEVDPSSWDLSEIKQQFLVPLFDRMEATRANPVYRVLQQHFPLVTQFIAYTKTLWHQELAHQCQSVEASIMIDFVCGQFMRDHPDAPITPVHDELIVPARLEAYARELITEGYSRIGCKPKIK